MLVTLSHLSLDHWTSRQAHSFLAVDLQWLSDDFQMDWLCLDFVRASSHTAEDTFNHVMDVLEEFGASKKVSQVVGDTTGCMINTFEMLRRVALPGRFIFHLQDQRGDPCFSKN